MAVLMMIAQYDIYDFSLDSDTFHDNPFMVNVLATMEHESGEKIEDIPGFYNGDEKWVIRFSPTRTGRWRGRTRSDDPKLSGIELGPIECVENENPNVHGKLQIDPAHPQRFAWEDSAPFVIMGFECDWLFSYHQEKSEKCREHVQLIKDRGFNYIVMNIYAHTGFSQPESRRDGDIIPGTVYAPPRMYVFGGTNDEPDHTKLNIDFFKDYDQMMAILHEKGVVAHLMIQVQNKHVRWPERLSAEDDLYWRHVIARYQAFGNVVWDIGKESYNLLGETGSHEYTINRINLIRSMDAYDHLVTVHDSESGSQGRYSEADAVSDFVSDQIHLKDIDRYNREAIRKLRILSKPYLNIEYGYELGAENLKTYSGGTTAPWRDVLDWTYALYLAGAYPCYYYSNTSWDLIKFEPEPEGWKRYQYLKEALDSVSFNRMESMNELVESGYCLADPGSEYLVYLPEGGDAQIDLTAVSSDRGQRGQWVTGDTRVAGEWMVTYTGERREVEIEPSGWNTRIENPFEDRSQPCVLIVRVAEGY